MNFINTLMAKTKASTTKAAETIDNAAKSILTEKIIMVSVDKLHFDKDYKAVFKQEEDKVKRIAEDMKIHGYDKSQPLIVDKNLGILDGSSRFMATQIAGIKKVPVVIKQFKNKKDAILYELNLQMNRRNIASDDVLIETYHTIAAMTDEKGNKLFTDVEIAKKLGVSPRQISKAKEVDLKASVEIKESLSEGTISLNQAYNQMKEEIKPTEEKAEVQEEVTTETTSVEVTPVKPKKTPSEKPA
ncbi:MAG: ParB/RepB/Spo0J family partition protein, partial [Treponema sp.]|nr:ParB/RepB/Spo0J family partition protein [Treponema sp.]